MKQFFCDKCEREIKINRNSPRVIFSNGILLCSKRCAYNHYDINFIPRVSLPEILGTNSEEQKTESKEDIR